LLVIYQKESMSRIIQQSGFILRFRYWNKLLAATKKLQYSLLGMQIGRNPILSKLYVTWPNQVAIGDNCVLEHDIHFKFVGLWKEGKAIRIGNDVFIGCNCEFNITAGIEIGDDCLIASGCRFIDHDHGIKVGVLMRNQHGAEMPIVLGNNVWLGCNVIVLKGVSIGDGAIVAAGAVVTKSILPNEIWAGVPARKVGQRS
jgi:acetyltransferase-like isoleucine patch superfamily enzyme